MDFVAEIVKEAAKYGMVPRIGARNDDKCTIVLLCKPPETQCCVSASLSGLEVLQNDDQVLDLIKGRVKDASLSIESLLSSANPVEWRPVEKRYQKYIGRSGGDWIGTNWFKDSLDGELYPEIPDFVKDGMKALSVQTVDR